MTRASEDLRQPCPACGGAFARWSECDAEAARCTRCSLVLVAPEELRDLAVWVAKSSEERRGGGFPRDGSTCPCGGTTRVALDRAWLVCERCARVLLPWSEVQALAADPDKAEVDPGVLQLRELEPQPRLLSRASAAQGGWWLAGAACAFAGSFVAFERGEAIKSMSVDERLAMDQVHGSRFHRSFWADPIVAVLVLALVGVVLFFKALMAFVVAANAGDRKLDPP